MANPKIYGAPYSTYVRSARLALEEKGVAYDIESVDILSGVENNTPEHLARHPFAKIPAFEHDGFALYEGCAIMRYVDEAFNGPPLQPGDARERARMTQAMSIIDSYAYPSLLQQIVIQRLVVPMMGGTTDEEAVANAVPQARTSVGALEALLDGNAYLAGSALSLADLHFVPICDYVSKTPEGEGLLGDAPNLTRWWAEMSERASVKTTAPQLD